MFKWVGRWRLQVNIEGICDLVRVCQHYDEDKITKEQIQEKIRRCELNSVYKDKSLEEFLSSKGWQRSGWNNWQGLFVCFDIERCLYAYGKVQKRLCWNNILHIYEFIKS